MSNAISKVLGIVGALVVGVATQDAHAGQVQACSVQFVRLVNEHVVVRCTTGTDYHIWGTGWTACNSRMNSDSFKLASSLAQSAFLAGKPLMINFDTDSSCPIAANAVSLIQIGAGL